MSPEAVAQGSHISKDGESTLDEAGQLEVYTFGALYIELSYGSCTVFLL